MKKIICMLTVLLCSVMNLSAQNYNLEGRWVTDLSDENETTSLIFLFEGNELTQAVYGESNVEGVGLVGVIVATPPAPFKLEGNKLTVTYDASQAEYQVMKTEYTDMTALPLGSFMPLKAASHSRAMAICLVQYIHSAIVGSFS